MIERYTRPEMARIWEDEFKFETMLQVELLALDAYSRKGHIPRQAAARIRKKARFDLAEIRRIEDKTHHDIVAFVLNVSHSIGDDAQYFHMGLTSSDLLDTTLGVQLQKASDILLADLKKLKAVLAKKARKYKDMVCIGRTHGVHAEPTTFGLKLALWYDETNRNIRRLTQAREAVSIGKISGAVGTYANIEPDIETYICRKIGLKPAPISTQVIQRDVYAEFLTTLAVIGSTIEKIALEIRHLQRTEVHEAEEPFRQGQKGSSAMPHKRNPVICERLCGLSRLLRGNALVALENVALWHERDISHSSAERVIMPDSTITLDYMLFKCTEVIEGLKVFPDMMLANLVRTHGLLFSQRVLLELMNKGLTRSQAYDIVQRCAMKSWEHNLSFKETLLKDEDLSSYLSEGDLSRIFDLDYYVRHVDKIFKKLGL